MIRIQQLERSFNPFYFYDYEHEIEKFESEFKNTGLLMIAEEIEDDSDSFKTDSSVAESSHNEIL